jgi:RNA polymerase sigma-70 factor (ECF subfamily)
MTIQFQDLVLNQMPKLRAYARSLTRNASDADDLLQTAAERMLRFESQFEVGSNFSAWAYRVLKNSHISNCRTHKRRPVSLTQYTEEAIPQTSLISQARQEEHVYAREVINALDRLSPNLREILTLICGAQLSYEEVADTLSCSVGTVKSRLWRARDQMKIILLGAGEAETLTPALPRAPAPALRTALALAA